jgi:hypothetical protein
MVAQDDDAPLESRPPELSDLTDLCRRLNETGAKYIVIGGMAMWHHGFVRSTEDIDLLVDSSPENFARIKSAMLGLPDGAIREVDPGDLDRYVVVRVGDLFVVDLMKTACGIQYPEASHQASISTIEGIPIPFANPELMLRLKQTPRPKDEMDRHYLLSLIQENHP